MAYAVIDFDVGVKYIGNRPKGSVVLRGPGGRHGTTWSAVALVDTGADYMHLPSEAIQGVGLTLQNVKRYRISTAGGIVTMCRASVDVEIEGVAVNVPVNFAKGAKALIGRQAIFKVLEGAGFDTKEWLLKWQASGTHSSAVSSQSAVSLPAQPTGTTNIGIVDHGSWLEIGGVRIDKRGD